MKLTPRETPRRPAYRRPSLVGLVMAGGTVGTAVRAQLETTFAAPAGRFPWATLGINVSGAFLLGLLLELIVLHPGDPRRRQALQLTLGTGMLGGYTTYSTFVLEAISLEAHGVPLLALGYVVASLVAGFAAAFLAMGTTRAVVRRARAEDHR